MKYVISLSVAFAMTLALAFSSVGAAEKSTVMRPINERFTSMGAENAPDFQRHVAPLMGRLGCNGRACHGSFQGRGGFQLSLFGYDFKFDHEALVAGDDPRVDVETPLESMILNKPISEDDHEGGKRMEQDSWQYNVFRSWIESGAKLQNEKAEKLTRLEIVPAEILFSKTGEKVQLQAIAVWADGTREDVTPLCRFRTNDDQIADVDKSGLVSSGEKGDTHIVVFYDNGVTPVPMLQPVSDLVADKYPQTPTPTKIDQLVVQKLRKLGIVQSGLAGDSEFLRRVRFDMTGSLPSAEEATKFFADKSTDKRAKKIEELLETPEYTAWWTTRLCDFTGNNNDALVNTTPVRGRASQDWYDWIKKRVDENMPYDELAAGIILAKSRQPGQSYMDYTEEMSKLYHPDSETQFADRDTLPYYWARRNFRQPEERVIGFAYSFMGLRIQCAQCHKHPFDQWSKDDFEQFKGFFTSVVSANNPRDPESRNVYNTLMEDLGLKGLRGGQLRRELPKLLKEGKTVPFPEVYALKPQKASPKNKKQRQQQRRRRGPRAATSAKLLGGELVDLTEYEDGRIPLMNWLRSPDNPYFARAFVNRVWASYFNVGIVNPPDDISLANPPSNKALLDYLTEGFIDSGFDMKWVHREIANSRTYQLSWRPNDTNQLDEKNFSRSVPRRLPAEVAYDALQLATASDERAADMHVELTGRAIAIPGSGRRGRRGPTYALTIFGRSTRESNCDCDRSSEASLLQTVFLQNDQEVLSMINRANGSWLRQVSQESGIGAQFAQSQRSQGAAGANNARKGKNAKVNKYLASKSPKELRQMVAKAQKRIKKLQEAGKTEEAQKLRAKFNRQRQNVQKELARRKQQQQVAVKKDKPNAKNTDQAKPYDATEVIRQAYLRTLTRYPNDEELARSQKHIDEADNKVEGIRDVFWALLNTKEFIVNH